MTFPRQSGILLHPTSLPGPYGIGELGSHARDFVDLLAEMGQSLWQVLPLGPTGYGDSPYQSFSTFAGNHLLVSFDALVADGLLDAERLERFPRLNPERVEFGEVIPARMAVLAEVVSGFARCAAKSLFAEFEQFCATHGADWLDDYALFVALKDAHGGRPWTDWEDELIERRPEALHRVGGKLRTQIETVKVLQFLFFRQWRQLRAYCHEKDLHIIGDLPIFVAQDSADVWAHPELFYLDQHGRPIVIAGTPPDYFSATGQRWGNPLYRWDVLARSNFDWWTKRLRATFEMVDILRIDHFRGFQAYWEISADEPTAVNGHWVPGPGADFFDVVLREFGDLPIIAEDLGRITPEVEALRDRFGLPGMRVLQFGFGSDMSANHHHPNNYPTNCVCYTGTHDNDTTLGWFHGADTEGSTRSAEQIAHEQKVVLDYLGTDGSEIHWDLIRLAHSSRANTVVVPLQDVLGLDSRARMNRPGRATGNWGWRFQAGAVGDEIVRRLRDITQGSGRTR